MAEMAERIKSTGSKKKKICLEMFDDLDLWRVAAAIVPSAIISIYATNLPIVVISDMILEHQEFAPSSLTFKYKNLKSINNLIFFLIDRETHTLNLRRKKKSITKYFKSKINNQWSTYPKLKMLKIFLVW